MARRTPSSSIELPVHKWVERVAHAEPQHDHNWPRELVRRRERLQRERLQHQGDVDRLASELLARTRFHQTRD